MRILIALLVLCSIDAFGQYRVELDTAYTPTQKTITADTTFGAIIAMAENVVTAIGGFRIDSLEYGPMEVPCPDPNYFGCAVLHWGYGDRLVSSTYWTIYKGRHKNNPKKWKILQVPEKYIIKFIE